MTSPARRLLRSGWAVVVCLVVLLASSAAAAAAGPTPAVRVATVIDPRIAESSGLVVSPSHPGLVWTVNDSGSGPVLYGVSSRTGRTAAVLRLAGVELRDAEALAAGRDFSGRAVLWVGDIGDNREVRDSVVLRLVHEPPRVASQTVAVTSLRLRYPDGPADAETLVWLPDGRLLIITKAFLTARVYQVPAAAVAQVIGGHDVSTPVVAQRLGTISQTLATDGGALPDGRVVVRGYESATVYSWAGTGPARTLQPVETLELPAQQQGEGIAVEPGGRTALLSSEGVRQPLYRVTLPAAASPSPSPTPTPSASNGAGQRRDTPSEVGAPSSTSGMQQGAPVPLVGAAVAGGAVLLAALVLAGVRGARRRSRRTG